MSEVVFYEKPGCITNARQKRLLAAHGHRLVVRDLLAEPWTAARLRQFFGERPVSEWFNPSAPSVRDGQIATDALGPEQALAMMLTDPILIRRPLLETAAGRCAGFAPGAVLDALGIQFPVSQATDACSRTHHADWAGHGTDDVPPTGSCRNEASG
jgi:nitrogenase-associated protein